MATVVLVVLNDISRVTKAEKIWHIVIAIKNISSPMAGVVEGGEYEQILFQLLSCPYARLP
jgi:hypothetical protein